MSSRRTGIRLFVLALVAVVVVAGAPFVGMRAISVPDLLQGGLESRIFFDVRLPRVLVGFLAGGALALCGMVFQAMFRNPLATPYTLGVSSGASFGAAVTILFGSGSILGLPLTGVGALLGALASMALVYGFSRAARVGSNLTVLLAGVAVSFIFSSFLMFAQYLSDLRHSFAIVRWLMGGVEVFGMGALWRMLPLYVAGVAGIAWRLPELDHLMTGDDIAMARGVAVERTRTFLYFATSMVVSAVVAVCGPIGFVGMMAPHLCRMLFGNHHRWLGPASFVFGGTFLVTCDTLARTVVAPTEIPVGVITALSGGPFFLWVLLRRMRGSGSVFT